jgi:two-component system cell cycle sensor histidine kinase/response regulator CckA
VQQAGGAIYVYSEPGRGSVFKVYFPRIELPVEVAADRPKAPDLSRPPATDGVILLVEDESGVRAFAAQVLSAAGYKVVEAGNGVEALEIAARLEAPLALLLTDVVMPDLNGRVLADRLHTVHPNLPVLYTSGYTGDMVLRAGVMTEDAAFLQKPFTPEVLLERVQAMLTQARQPAE